VLGDHLVAKHFPQSTRSTLHLRLLTVSHELCPAAVILPRASTTRTDLGSKLVRLHYAHSPTGAFDNTISTPLVFRPWPWPSGSLSALYPTHPARNTCSPETRTRMTCDGGDVVWRRDGPQLGNLNHQATTTWIRRQAACRRGTPLSAWWLLALDAVTVAADARAGDALPPSYLQ
jgi:hypothetical protein